MFEIKHRAILNKTTEKLVNDLHFAQKSAIDSNQAVIISAIDQDWSNGWVIDELKGDRLKTFNSNNDNLVTIFNKSNINAIHFKPSGLTKKLSPLGSSGMKICNVQGQGNQLEMIASGFVRINNIPSNCNA